MGHSDKRSALHVSIGVGVGSTVLAVIVGYVAPDQLAPWLAAAVFCPGFLLALWIANKFDTEQNPYNQGPG